MGPQRGQCHVGPPRRGTSAITTVFSDTMWKALPWLAARGVAFRGGTQPFCVACRNARVPAQSRGVGLGPC
jgi:hypothetical protein